MNRRDASPAWVWIALAATACLAFAPGVAAAAVSPACEPLVGSVPGLVAVPGDWCAKLSWESTGSGRVRIIRSGSGYVTDPVLPVVPAALVGPACWNYEPKVVYEGTATSRYDAGLENGFTYYYTAFLWDDVAAGWMPPSGVYVTPQGIAPLTKPGVPTWIVEDRGFVVRGSIVEPSPFTTSVRVVVSRKIGGVWRYWKSSSRTIPAGTASYRLWMSVPEGGAVRLQAKHADADHRLSISPARYFWAHHR